MTAAARPFPRSPVRQRPALVLACAGSLLVHGGLLAAVHWATGAATPIRIPPMLAIPVIDAAHLTPSAATPARPPAPAAPTAPAETKAPSPRRAETTIPSAPARPEAAKTKAAPRATAKPNPETPKTAPAPARPAWTQDPPVPPRRPIALAGLRPAALAPGKPGPAEPKSETPPFVKATPVTAPREGLAKLRPASSAPAGTGKAAPPHAPLRTGVSPASSAGLGNPPPAYPWIARQRGEEGRVVLEVEVTSEGRARAVRIKRTSGSNRLDRAAVAAVQDWRFAPARRAGLAISGRIDVPITFRLTD